MDIEVRKNRYRKIALVLNVIFVVGLIGHALLFFVMDTRFRPLVMDTETFNTRVVLRESAEFLFSICYLVYAIGHIFLLVMTAFRKISVPIKTVLAYFGLQLVWMAACTLPFACMDRSAWGNYFAPLWVPIAEIAIMCVVGLLLQVRRRPDHSIAPTERR